MSTPARIRIFVAGSTGNTGAPCVHALSKSGRVDVVAMTRSKSSDSAKQLAALPNVTVVEVEYSDPPGLKRALAGCHRAYIACHNGTSHFQDETNFYTACVQSDVKYVVKLATHNAFIGYTSPIWYGRTHLALEDWLEKLQLPYTSLRANGFVPVLFMFADRVAKANEYPATFKGHSGAFIVPADVGEAAAALLLLDDPSPHYSQRYLLSGPEDVSDEQFKSYIEEARGPEAPKLKTVQTDVNDILLPIFKQGKPYVGEIESVQHAWPVSTESGRSALALHPTSEGIVNIGAAPKRTVRQAVLDARDIWLPK